MGKMPLKGRAGYFINQALDPSYRRGPSGGTLLDFENNLAFTEGQHPVAGRAFPSQPARSSGIELNQQKAPTIEDDRDFRVFLLKEPPVLHYNVHALLLDG